MTTPDPSCGNCRNGRPVVGVPGVVSCRAKSPVAFLVAGGPVSPLLVGSTAETGPQTVSVWPAAPAEEWCAEHRPAKGPSGVV